MGLLEAQYTYFFDIIHFQIPRMVWEMENFINQIHWLGEKLKITELIFITVWSSQVQWLGTPPFLT